MAVLILGATTAAAQSPPDSVARRPASGFTLSGDLLRALPIDDPRDALALFGGVVSRDKARGVLAHGDASLRGSPAGEASVYIDGAPARWELFGTDGMVPGLAAIDTLAVTTGVADAAVADARGGVISYLTRSGGDTLAGALRAESDEFFADGSSVGYNRFEGWLGGPVPGVAGLTWFVSGTAQGQRSQYRGVGAADLPLYTPGGIDVFVSDTLLDGSVVTQALPRYVQFSGVCGRTGNTSSPVGREIRDNYGFECQGLRRPMDWSTAIRLHGKLAYTYGAGGRFSVTGLAAGRQRREFPGTVIGAPSLYGGTHAWSRLVVASWGHPLRLAGRDALLRANLSLGTDRSVAGPLESSSELETRDPMLGIELGTLAFTGLDVFPFPITDRIIRNVRTNAGLRVPYLDRPGLRNAQRGRFNPYGLAGNGWYTSGLDAALTLADERRLHGRASLEWRVLPRHWIALGMDVARTDASYYTSALLRQTGDAFIGHPRRWGVFAWDRIALGNLVLDLGARWDHHNSNALYPRTPGRLFSHPRFANYLTAATDDAVYAAYIADDSIWAGARSRSAITPRLHAAYSFGKQTVLHASYAQRLEPPSLGALLTGTNSDLSFTSVSAVFGRDVELARTAAAELGLRHAFGGGWAVDAAVHRHDALEHYGARVQPFPEPRDPTDTISLPVLTRLDLGPAIGVDLRLDWRRADIGSVAASYTLQRADPGAGGDVVTQSVAGVLGLSVPEGWSRGSALGAAARGLSAHATVRFTSGVPYTRLRDLGGGFTLRDGFGFGQVAGPLNGARLAWSRHADLRVRKRWQARGMAWSAYVDLRNLLGLRSQVDVFTETGTVFNARHRGLVLQPELDNLAVEGSIAGALQPDGTVDLRGNCGAWSLPVNCVSLQRVENRFGDGDGLYTLAEQRRALNAFYDAFFGSWRFYEPGRTLRIGMEVGF